MYKLLLVEDDPVCSASINKLLADFCQVHITSSAAIALNLAIANRYNLVMIDVNLHTGSSGIGTANSIKNMTNYSSIPIVAFSIDKLSETREYLLSRGYTHFIHEPFNIRNFAQQIKFILSTQIKMNKLLLMQEDKTPYTKIIY